MVLRPDNISESLWSQDVYVRPYWKTFDGVIVTGLAKYVYVQDGIDGWISVPIGLYTGDNVAVGMVSVEIPDGLEFQEWRTGVVFKEMNVITTGNTINCVGNGTYLVFTVKNMEFCNLAEETIPMKILNVRY